MNECFKVTQRISRASKWSLGNGHSSLSFPSSQKHSYQTTGPFILWDEPLLKCLSSFADVTFNFWGDIVFCMWVPCWFSKQFLRTSPCKYNTQAKAQAQAAGGQHHSSIWEVLLINIVYDSCHSQHSLLTRGLDLVSGENKSVSTRVSQFKCEGERNANRVSPVPWGAWVTVCEFKSREEIFVLSMVLWKYFLL